MMPPEVSDVCFKLRKGQVSDVVETPYGVHIFKLVDRRDATENPFPEVEHAIEAKLQRVAVQKAQMSYLEKLRSKTPVKIFENEVQKVM
jgi:peptidyl-prolyl cis-trans isomerase C/foldase protein PrsA